MGQDSKIQWTHHTFQSVDWMLEGVARLQELLCRGVDGSPLRPGPMGRGRDTIRYG